MAIPRRSDLVALTILLLLAIACGQSAPIASPTRAVPSPEPPIRQAAPTEQTDESNVVVIRNQGGAMEGHTPRGFRGMGTGLFAGDNLNPRFPEGDGVQIFLTFDLNAVPAGKIVSAVLRSNNVSIRGMPLKDLGALRAEEIRYDKFSSELWNLEPLPGGAVCEFATSPNGPFQCDLAKTVQRSLNDSYPLAQFRLLLDRAGNSDGTPDMVVFFISNSNTNQPGIFELEVTVAPES
ncbi:MAG TPA: hypothetical protein EYM54_05715 [Dehalococcoidia bacterium]|nr:hypothetical protein [Dehalococcoidia bacterium]